MLGFWLSKFRSCSSGRHLGALRPLKSPNFRAGVFVPGGTSTLASLGFSVVARSPVPKNTRLSMDLRWGSLVSLWYGSSFTFRAQLFSDKRDPEISQASTCLAPPISWRGGEHRCHRLRLFKNMFACKARLACLKRRSTVN